MANAHITLTPTQRLVIGVLCRQADYQTRETWIGMRAIADRARIAKSTVQSALKDLSVKGVIQKAGTHPTPNGEATVWRVCPECWEQFQQGMYPGPSEGTDKGTNGTESGTDQILIKNLIKEQDQNLIETLYRIETKLDQLLIRTQIPSPKSSVSLSSVKETLQEIPSGAAAPALCQNSGCYNPARADGSGFCSYECEKEHQEFSNWSEEDMARAGL